MFRFANCRCIAREYGNAFFREKPDAYSVR